MGKCKDCWNATQQYGRIIITGGLTVSFVWGLYRLLNDISVLKELKDDETGLNIHCTSKNDPHDLYQGYCEDLISNSIIDCDGESGIDDTTGIIQFSSFQTYLWSVIIFSVLSAVCSIIHDFYLIYNKDTIKYTFFYPNNHKENSPIKGADQKTKCKCCANFCSFICNVFINISCLLPCGRFWYGLFCQNGKCKCSEFARLSSLWVGFMRLAIVTACGWIMVTTANGVSLPVELDKLQSPSNADINFSYDGNCRCECEYYLLRSDFVAYLLVSLLLILRNVWILWSWTDEAIYGKGYLYLKQYRLQVDIAHKLNRNDVAGTMFKPHGMITLGVEPMQYGVSPVDDDDDGGYTFSDPDIAHNIYDFILREFVLVSALIITAIFTYGTWFECNSYDGVCDIWISNPTDRKIAEGLTYTVTGISLLGAIAILVYHRYQWNSIHDIQKCCKCC